MLIQEKQGFSSLDFFTIVFSFAFIIYISAPIISRHLEAEGINKAEQDIAELSHSLLQPAPNHESFLASAPPSKHSNRGIASVDPNDSSGDISSQRNILASIKNQKDTGEIGVDPWGKPYHYLFVRNMMGTQTHLVLWSEGPDRRNQTEVQAQVAQRTNAVIVAFQGDDVGSVIPVR